MTAQRIFTANEVSTALQVPDFVILELADAERLQADVNKHGEYVFDIKEAYKVTTAITLHDDEGDETPAECLSANSSLVQLTPEVVERFARYYEKNPTWGALHVVLDEPNYKPVHVWNCLEQALEEKDDEGAALARLMLLMSSTQRQSIDGKVYNFLQTPHITQTN